MKTLVAWLVVLLPVSAPAQVLYKTGAYTLTGTGVTEGRFEAAARSRSEVTSTYRSDIDASIGFAFAINGSLVEMASYETNRLFFSSRAARVVSPLYVFGLRESSDFVGRGSGERGDDATSVTLRLDMRAVLAALKANGAYTLWDGKRVTAAEFTGVSAVGDRAPFAAAGVPLADADGDGIYEADVKIDPKESGAAPDGPRTWRLERDLSSLPASESPFPLMDALYAMSLEEMLADVRPDGTFMAGKLWDGVWTRDISHSIVLSLAIVKPDVAKTSLMRKVADGRIIQDTGTGGSWPVSTDRTVWALAAWEVYAVTGDRDWLQTSYEIVRKSTDADLATVRASNRLFGGESDFMDWREQSYPRWMEPRDIAQSQSFSTNCVHYQTYRTLGRMARLLGRGAEAATYEGVAASLRMAIDRELWVAERRAYGEYRYGRMFPVVSPRAEALGDALAVLFEIPPPARRAGLIARTPVVDFGVPDFSPQTPNMPAYHNNAIWPFVVGYWTWAAAETRNAAAVEHGLGAIYRQAALFLTNKENMRASTGDPATMLNSDRQLWSVAANLATVYRVLYGMRFEPDRLVFRPFVPAAYAGTRRLTNLTYRGATLDVTLEGSGDRVRSATLDGHSIAEAAVPGTLTGHHVLVLRLGGTPPAGSIARAPATYAPETPVARLEGGEVRWAAVDSARAYRVVVNGRPVSTTAGTSFGAPAGAFAEVQVAAIDARGVESFLSAPVEAVPAGARVEAAASPSGAVRLERGRNTTVEIPVAVKTAGRYGVRFRYANGNGPVNTENKAAIRSLSIDGRRVGAVVMPQRGTNWDDFGMTNVHVVRLAAGRHVLRLTFEPSDENMNGAVNEAVLDRAELTRIGG